MWATKCLLRLRGVSAPVAGAIKHTHAIRVRQVEGWGKTARGRGTTLFNMQNACNFLVYNLKFQRSQRAVLTDTKKGIYRIHTDTQTRYRYIFTVCSAAFVMSCGKCPPKKRLEKQLST